MNRDYLDECDRLAYHAEAMRDFAERNLAVRQRSKKREYFYVGLFILIGCAVAAVRYWR